MPHPTQPEAGNPDRDVTERLARFARSGNPYDLWPALSEDALATARRAIANVVSAVLRNAQGASLDAGDEDSVYALRIAAYSSGSGALLGRWVEDGRLQAPPAAREMLALELERGRRRAERIEREVLPAIDALLSRGITPVALKGFHTAREYCEEPGVRPCADVDLLVPPERVADAERALASAGFSSIAEPVVRPYQRHWIGPNVDDRTFSIEGVDERNRWMIDLHTSFDRKLFSGNVALDAARACVARFDVAGRSLLAPAQPLLALSLACQLSTDLNSMRLMRLVDLVRVIRDDLAARRLDWDEMLVGMTRTGSARVAYPAFALAEQLAPGTIEPRVLAHMCDTSNPAIRRTVARLVPAGGSLDASNLTSYLMFAQSPLDVAAFVLRKLRGGPQALMRTIRVMLRRVLAGKFTFEPFDEVQRPAAPQTPPPRRPPP